MEDTLPAVEDLEPVESADLIEPSQAAQIAAQPLPDQSDLEPVSASPRPVASMTKAKTLQALFNYDDPLDFFGPDKEDIAKLFEGYPDPVLERKKMALAEYYAFNTGLDSKDISGRIEDFNQRYFGDKTNIDGAYKQVREILNGAALNPVSPAPDEKQSSAISSYLKSVGLGIYGVGSNIMAALIMNLPFDKRAEIRGAIEERRKKFASIDDREQYELIYLENEKFKLDQLRKLSPLTISEADIAKEKAKIDRKMDLVKFWYNARRVEAAELDLPIQEAKAAVAEVVRSQKEAIEKYQRDYHNPKGLAGAFEEGVLSGAAELGALVADQASSLISMAATYVAGGHLFSLLVLAASSAGGRIVDLEGNSELSDEEKMTNAVIYGLSEAIPEYLFGSLKYFKRIEKAGAPAIGAFKKGIANRMLSLLKSGAGAAVSENTGELATLYAEKMGDALMGINPDGTPGKRLSEMSKEEIKKWATDGLLETVLVSSIIGGGLGGVENIRGQLNYAETERARHQVKRLLESRRDELLAKEDISEDETSELHTIQSYLESNDIDGIVGRANEAAIDRARLEKKAQFDNERDFPDLDDDEISALAAREQAAINAMPHHPEDTVEAIESLKAEFPSLVVEVFDGADRIPDNVRRVAESRGYDPKEINGFVDDNGVVYVNARRVRPHNVASLMLEEHIGHSGIEAVFPREKLDPVLDLIADSYPEQIATFAARYNLDLSTVRGRRDAAKEFIAHGATQQIKPSYWKEIIYHIKAALRKIPGLANIRFTDSEIEGMLSAAYRYMRKHDNVKFSISPEDSPDIRFSIGDRRIKTTELPDYGPAGAGRIRSLYAKAKRSSNQGRNSNEGISQETSDQDSSGQVKFSIGNHLVRQLELDGIKIAKPKEKEFIPAWNALPARLKNRDGSGMIMDLVHLHLELEGLINPTLVYAYDLWDMLRRSDVKPNAYDYDTGRDWDAELEAHLKAEGSWYSEEDKQRMAAFLLPLVRKMNGVFPDEKFVFDTLKTAGFPIRDVDHAHMIYVEAVNMRRRRNAEIAKAKKDKWLKTAYPILSKIKAEYGDKVRVKPGPEYIKSVDFDNSDFLSKRYGKNTVHLHDIVGTLKLSGDDVIAELNGLTSKKINELYNEYRKSGKKKVETFSDAYRELRKRRDFDLAIEISQGLKPLTDDIIIERPEVAREVYLMAMGEPMPPKPQWSEVKRRIAEVNPAAKALETKKEGAMDNDALSEIVRKMADRAETNVELLQPILRDYVRNNIKDTDRAKSLLEDIAGLHEYSSAPTPAYPEGRQFAAMERILQDIISARESEEKTDMIRRIDERLDQTNLRRVGKGRVVSLYGDAQAQLDRIREIRSLPEAAVVSMIEAHQIIDKGGDPSDHQLEAAMLEKYGMLESKSRDELQEVLRDINTIALSGRNKLKEFLNNRREQIAAWRETAKNEITGGKGLMSPQQADIAEAKRRESRVKSAVWKEVLQARDLEFLLSDITRETKDKEFTETQMYKEFFRRVHDAYQAKMTGIRKRGEAFNEAFDRIFGSNGARQRAKIVIELKKLVEHSGVFRHQLSDEIKYSKGIEFDDVSIEEARKMLAEYDSGTTGSLTDYQAEAIRMKLADIDQRLKQSLPRGMEAGDDYSDAILKALMDETKKDVVRIPRVKERGPLTEQPLSQLTGLYLLLCWDQPSVRYKMHFNGWTNESIDQLRKFVRDDVKALGKYMVADLAKDLGSINEVYNELYMTTVSGLPNYFPTVYPSMRGVSDMTNPYSGVMSISPGALSSRRFHLLDPVTSDALAVYQQHVAQMEHFKTHAAIVRDLRAVFNDTGVKTAIRQYYGPETYSFLVRKIDDFANGGNINATMSAFLDKLQITYARARIWWNIVSGIKQIFGAASYVQDIPFSAFVKGLAKFAANPIEITNMFRETEYFKNRWAGSINRDIAMMASIHNYSAKDAARLLSGLDELGSLSLRLGDAFATFAGGYAVYSYHYENLIKDGYSEADAHKAALKEWELSTERTQQSGAVHKLNRYQLDSSFSRIFTTFQSNPILAANAFIEALMDAKEGRKGGRIKLARRAFTAFVVSGLVMDLISQAAKHGIDLDEYELERLALNLFRGPFGAYTGIDVVLSSALETLLRASGYGSNDIFDDVSGVVALGYRVYDYKFEDIDEEELYKAVEKGLIGVGLARPEATHAGAIMREIRRIFNFLNKMTGEENE